MHLANCSSARPACRLCCMELVPSRKFAGALPIVVALTPCFEGKGPALTGNGQPRAFLEQQVLYYSKSLSISNSDPIATILSPSSCSPTTLQVSREEHNAIQG